MKTMPRCVSTVMKPQTLTPARFFQLSPLHESLNFSPAPGIDLKVQTSLPVWMSQALTSPAGPSGGFSWLRPPVMIRLRYIVGGEAIALLPGKPRRISGVLRLMEPFSPKAALGWPVLASSE
jgi:hypothetical protein